MRAVASVPMREPVDEKTWTSHLTKKEYYSLNRLRSRELTSPRYTVSFVTFFDNEIRKAKGDWKKVVSEYLYSSPSPLINGFCGGRKSTLELTGDVG